MARSLVVAGAPWLAVALPGADSLAPARPDTATPVVQPSRRGDRCPGASPLAPSGAGRARASSSRRARRGPPPSLPLRNAARSQRARAGARPEQPPAAQGQAWRAECGRRKDICRSTTSSGPRRARPHRARSGSSGATAARWRKNPPLGRPRWSVPSTGAGRGRKSGRPNRVRHRENKRRCTRGRSSPDRRRSDRASDTCRERPRTNARCGPLESADLQCLR